MTSPATFSLALPNETATAHLMADLALLTGPGDVITLPTGLPHNARNLGDSDAVLLVTFSSADRQTRGE